MTDRESLIAESPAKLSFDDSAAYERFVGTWGRAAGSMFLQWLDPPKSADWLDVGCGTGLFTELIVRSCAPASVIGIDPAPTQINYASRKPIAAHASFRTGDAEALPLRDATFDIVASALVINFIPDRPRALSEMSRVARPGGLVGGYSWDFEAELSPSGPSASRCVISSRTCLRFPGLRTRRRRGFGHCSNRPASLRSLQDRSRWQSNFRILTRFGRHRRQATRPPQGSLLTWTTGAVDDCEKPSVRGSNQGKTG